jgi:hypothetical protein
VVPSIAADLWNVPVDQVMQAVRDGAVQSHTAHGFTFVDVMPAGDTDEPSTHIHPPTFVRDGSSTREPAERRDDSDNAASDERPTDELDRSRFDPAQADSPLDDRDWKEVRKLTSALRIAPPRQFA